MSLRPRLLSQGPLGRRSGLDGVARAREDREERVPFPVDLDPTAAVERLADQVVVLRQDLAVVVAAERFQQARRPLDVREQEGDGAGRKLGYRFTQV
jgi:hypothetical protein